ncbi:hypothetical protein BYT27DRAFT_7257564 [Phlegmacium glaucopus]|nr:hypothetical protein BYT27DRAFT_7257564 [Phlegmacium glaucopus]
MSFKISTAGASECKLNDKTVHIRGLQCSPRLSHNILAKVKILLVFQGGVEGQYETAKEAQERATENAALNFTKRRGIAGEIKQYNRELCQEQGSTHPGTYLENKDLGGLRQEQNIYEKAPKACLPIKPKHEPLMRKEKNVQNVEKALDGKGDLKALITKAPKNMRSLVMSAVLGSSSAIGATFVLRISEIVRRDTPPEVLTTEPPTQDRATVRKGRIPAH